MGEHAVGIGVRNLLLELLSVSDIGRLLSQRSVGVVRILVDVHRRSVGSQSSIAVVSIALAVLRLAEAEDAAVVFAPLVRVLIGHHAVGVEDSLAESHNIEVVRVAFVGVEASVVGSTYEESVGVIVVQTAFRHYIVRDVAHRTAEGGSINQESVFWSRLLSVSRCRAAEH